MSQPAVGARRVSVIAVVQLLSRVKHFVTPRIAAFQVSLSSTIPQGLHKFMAIESVMLSNHLIFWHSLFLLPSWLPSIFQHQGLFQWLSIKQPKYWSFSFSNNPSNEYSGLISFRMDWLDLLAVQRTLKSLLQHHNSKASLSHQGNPWRISSSGPNQGRVTQVRQVEKCRGKWTGAILIGFRRWRTWEIALPVQSACACVSVCLSLDPNTPGYFSPLPTLTLSSLILGGTESLIPHLTYLFIQSWGSRSWIQQTEACS